MARERVGNLRTRVAVSLGIPWMYPRDKARRKVEMGGEPKGRCRYATKRARGRELRENNEVEGEEAMGARRREKP